VVGHEGLRCNAYRQQQGKRHCQESGHHRGAILAYLAYLAYRHTGAGHLHYVPVVGGVHQHVGHVFDRVFLHQFRLLPDLAIGQSVDAFT